MCAVCSVCGQCTGYGTECLHSGQANRNPGMPCGCGAGDSGCSECNICRTCAGEQMDFDKEDIDHSKQLEKLRENKDFLQFEMLMDGVAGNVKDP